MSKEFIFSTGAFELLLQAHKVKSSQKHLDLILTFFLNQETGKTSFKSLPGFICKEDLQRLIVYFKNHIHNLQTNPNAHSSPVFVTYELGFMIQALEGDISLDGEGNFSIQIMLNVGTNPKDGTGVYLGVESTVDVEEIKKLLTILQELINFIESRLEGHELS